METTHTQPDIPIMYEDNHLLVIDKPAGILSQADHTGDADVLTLCKQYLKTRYQKPGNVYLGLVHRLDRPVSGVMVLAKTSKAASRLSDEIRSRTFQKKYLAFVDGITPAEATLTHFLTKDSQTNIVTASSEEQSNAKRAVLHFKTIKQNTHYSLLEIDLITGRPHQIRVQLAAAGFPILGDYKYGKSPQKPGINLGLRASVLSFSHPTTKEIMYFTASLPDEQPWSILGH